MVVYVDILLILNLFVDYFLLLGCSVLVKINVKKSRLIFGAVIGSLFSLSIFAIDFSFLFFLFLKILSGLILIYITFGFKTIALFLKILIIFLLENFIFVGIMFCIWIMFSPPGMLWQNGVTYIAISPIILVIGSVIAYLLICMFNIMFSKTVDSKKIYLIKIKYNNKLVKLNALYDTGNCLTEPFSKKPICICEYNALKDILSGSLILFFKNFSAYSFDNVPTEKFQNIKLVPCDTISGESIIPAFLPQGVVIEYDGEDFDYDCYIGVVNRKISEGEYQAIVGDFK